MARIFSVAIAVVLLLAAAAQQTQGQACAITSSCNNCTLSGCSYCAFEGPTLQGTGACYSPSMTNASAACVDPKGSLLNSFRQCAAVLDECANYHDSCAACSAAPASLNCGWCASSGSCWSGTVAGPNNGQSCGGAGGDGWGWGSGACGPQAQCNTADGMGCSECFAQGEQCGYCESTQRCEEGSEAAGGAVDKDCPKAAGPFYLKGQCTSPMPPVDVCNHHYTCISCENAEDYHQCGWCATTNKCSTGNDTAPLLATCSLDGWLYQSCESDAVCWEQQDCAGCHSHSNCLWCADGSGQCLPGQSSPIPGLYCENVVMYSNDTASSVCPRGPLPGPADPSDDGPYPTVGKIALGLLLSFGCVAMVRAALYFVSSTRKTGSSFWGPPMLGARLLAGEVITRDYSNGCLRPLPALMVVMTLSCKVAALALNQWDAYYVAASIFSTRISVSVLYGLLGIRVVVHNNDAAAAQSAGDTVSYARACHIDDNGQASLSNDLRMCHTLRAAGITCMSFGVLSVLGSLAALALAIVLIKRPASLSAILPRLYRVTGATMMSSLACWTSWVLSAHLVLHHTEDGKPTLSASAFLMVAAWALDVLAIIYLSKAITATPDPEVGEFILQQQESYADAGLQAYDYAQMNNPPYGTEDGGRAGGGQEERESRDAYGRF